MTPDLLLEAAKKEGINRFVVGAVIISNDRVLLLKRKADDFMGGIFELPSGKVEGNEDLREALEREIVEETGLQVVVINSVVDTFDYESKSGKKTRQFNFDVETGPGEVKLSPEEHEDFRWVSRSEAEEVNVTDSVRDTLNKFWEDKDARKN